MAETNEPVHTEAPQAPTLPLDDRLRALGLGGQGAETDPRLAAYAAQLATLSSGLAAHRVQLRDLEKSLVERIADVDDDRRLTALQLQRAWQTQREELDDRLRSRGRLAAAALVLIAAMATGGLVGLFKYLESNREALEVRVDAVRLELDRLAGIGTRDTQVQEKLAALSAAVGQLSSTLGPLAERPARTAGQDGPAQLSDLAARIDRMAAEQVRNAQELQALHESLAARPIPPEGPAAGPSADPRSTPAAQPQAPPPADPRPAETPATPTDAAPEGSAKPSADGATSPPPVATPAKVGGAESASTGTATIAVADRLFALQLLGSYRRDDLLSLAARAGLPAEVFIRQESRRGRPWFVLIHSMHPTRAQAQAALAGLAPSLLVPKPWIRNLPPDATLELIVTGKGQ